jgi:hypothetical protein
MKQKKYFFRLVLISILFLLSLLLASAASLASNKVLAIDLEVYSNDTVIVNSVAITEGSHTIDGREGDYRVVVLDNKESIVFSKSIYLSFDYNGPVLVGKDYSKLRAEKINFAYRMPYNENMNKVLFYHRDKLLLSREIGAKAPEIPVNQAETPKEKAKQPVGEQFINKTVFIYFFTVSFIVVVLYIFYRRSKRKREGQLRLLRQADSQQLREMLKNAGWKEEDIEKYVKEGNK